MHETRAAQQTCEMLDFATHHLEVDGLALLQQALLRLRIAALPVAGLPLEPWQR